MLVYKWSAEQLAKSLRRLEISRRETPSHQAAGGASLGGTDVARSSAAQKSLDQDNAAPLAVTLSLNRKLPVGDQVYEALRKAVVTCQLLPGTSISENRVCRTFGVSRTPVRSAIARLAEEGLIDVYPQQGSFVAPIRLAGIADSQFVRKALEIAILLEAASVWTPTMSADVRSIIARQVEAIRAGDDDSFFVEDEAFHHAFARFTDRDGAWSTVMGAKAKLARFVRLFGNPGRLPVVIEEHLAIVQALDSGDAQDAARRLEYHLDRIFNLLNELPDQYRPYLAD
jgi:DNA-binding GntR family transcriptional regulator